MPLYDTCVAGTVRIERTTFAASKRRCYLLSYVPLAPDQRLELCKYGLWRPTRALRIRLGGEIA